MEYKFNGPDQATGYEGDLVKIPGFGRPGRVIGRRMEERYFAKRGDEGVRKKLAQPHYIVQLPASSSNRFYPESDLEHWEKH